MLSVAQMRETVLRDDVLELDVEKERLRKEKHLTRDRS
jgi:hypothetical protein